jgi:hypothetical protein
MSDQPTGADLVHQLWLAARAHGQPLRTFAAGLARDPNKFVQQLRAAQRPKPATIARIQALIEGRDLPPPANQPQRSDREQVRVANISAGNAAIEWRRALAEAAAAERRPGETLHAAVRRLETELRAAA